MGGETDEEDVWSQRSCMRNALLCALRCVCRGMLESLSSVACSLNMLCAALPLHPHYGRNAFTCSPRQGCYRMLTEPMPPRPPSCQVPTSHRPVLHCPESLRIAYERHSLKMKTITTPNSWKRNARAQHPQLLRTNQAPEKGTSVQQCKPPCCVHPCDAPDSQAPQPLTLRSAHTLPPRAILQCHASGVT
jgi:hypothetical protein